MTETIRSQSFKIEARSASFSSASSPKIDVPPFDTNRNTNAESSRPSTLPDGIDPPIRFTTSEASQWKATETLLLKSRGPEAWFYQPLVVCFSVACLLLWFGIFREENDIDEEIGKPLWERVPGLEKSQLHVVIKHNKEQGLPTAEFEKRLAEIREIEQKSMNK